MRRKTMFFFLWGSGSLRMRAHMAGLSVSATTVEISTEATMVTVTGGKACP